MNSFTNRFGMKSRIIAGAVATFAVGGVAGAGIASMNHHVEAMGPANLVPINQLEQASRPWTGDPIVTVRGRVAGVFGGQFLLDDGSGQVLVETGPRADTDALAQGQQLTVQGGYRDGVMHAQYLVNADGQVAAVGGPPRGPEHGPGPDGPGGPGGPHGGPGAPPPPPPGDARAPGSDAPPPPPPAANGVAPAAAPAPAPASVNVAAPANGAAAVRRQ